MGYVHGEGGEWYSGKPMGGMVRGWLCPAAELYYSVNTKRPSVEDAIAYTLGTKPIPNLPTTNPDPIPNPTLLVETALAPVAKKDFDAAFYAAQNPDVVASVGKSEKALYNHYKKYGYKEGRLPNANAAGVTASTDDFDAVYYAEHNPDVVAVFGADPAVLYQHYVMFGKAEGRKCHP